MSSSSKEDGVLIVILKRIQKMCVVVRNSQEFLRSLETRGLCLVVKSENPFSPLTAIVYSSVNYHFQLNPVTLLLKRHLKFA